MRSVAFLFALVFVLTAGRAFYLQVFKKEHLVKLAEKQHQRIVPLTPGRGAIYDQHNAPLAVSLEMDSCYAETRNLENLPEAAAKLAPILGFGVKELEDKLKASRNFVWLARRIPP